MPSTPRITTSVDNTKDCESGNAGWPQQPDHGALRQPHARNRNWQHEDDQSNRHEDQIVTEVDLDAKTSAKQKHDDDAQKLDDERESEYPDQDSATRTDSSPSPFQPAAVIDQLMLDAAVGPKPCARGSRPRMFRTAQPLPLGKECPHGRRAGRFASGTRSAAPMTPSVSSATTPSNRSTTTEAVAARPLTPYRDSAQARTTSAPPAGKAVPTKDEMRKTRAVDRFDTDSPLARSRIAHRPTMTVRGRNVGGRAGQKIPQLDQKTERVLLPEPRPVPTGHQTPQG